MFTTTWIIIFNFDLDINKMHRQRRQENANGYIALIEDVNISSVEEFKSGFDSAKDVKRSNIDENVKNILLYTHHFFI